MCRGLSVVPGAAQPGTNLFGEPLGAFDLPGQGPHPAVRAMWIVGGLLGVAFLVLGGAMWRHYAQRVAADEEAKALIRAREAEALAAVETAKARAAEAKAKAEAAKAAAAEAKAKAAAPTAVAAKTEGEGGAEAASGHHRSHHAKAGKGKVGAKAAGGDDKKVAQKSSGGSKRDDAAIDKLLASFK